MGITVHLMGNCTTKARKPPTGLARLPVPPIPRALPIKTSEAYSFSVKISHIKLRGLAQDSYRLKLSWGESHYESQEQTGCEIKVKAEWEFRVVATLEEMQSSWLVAALYSASQGKDIARVSICQWTLAVGPSYQNFALANAKKQVIGRVGMDVKVLQRTTLEIAALQISCDLGHEGYGKFSLTVRRSEHHESVKSHIAQAANWVFEDKVQTLSLAMETNIEELRTDSIQLRVWKHKRGEEAPNLVGECWLSLSKLLKDERFELLQKELTKSLEQSPADTSETYSPETLMSLEAARLEKPFQEKLWWCGRHIGTITGQLALSNIPCIAQQISGVNTEEGIQIQSTNFVERSSGNTVIFQKMALPAALVSISGLIDQLKEFVLTKPSGQTQSRALDLRNHIGKVSELMQNLRETEKETMVAHVYTGETELITGQSIFLDLGEYLLTYADRVVYEVRGYYYECLGHLMRRGELDLGHMNLDRCKDPALKQSRTSLAIRYRRFLRNLLTCAIAKMNIKGVDQRVQEFTETIMAIAYFRIPEFKDTLLNCLRRKSFYPVEEWRGTAFDLEMDVTVHSEYLPMFDWQVHFYRSLPEERDEEYEAAMREERWQRRMEKRGIAYFRFISQWANDVQRLFVHQHVPWQDIPGYNVILKSFLLELKERKVANYSEALIQASYSLLRYPNILSVFIVVVFSKTNLYQFKEVLESLKLVSGWLALVYERGVGLPTTFVTGFFIQALKAVLKDEAALSVAHGLKLIYRNYQVFSADMKRELVLELLLDSLAYQLMFHWSQIIRKIFWDFVLYRMYSLESIPLETATPLDLKCMGKAKNLVAFIEHSEDETSEKISESMAPYVKLTRSDLKTQQVEYSQWLEARQSDLATNQAKKGFYGPFGDFPYPDQPIEGIFEDELERKMEEEW